MPASRGLIRRASEHHTLRQSLAVNAGESPG